MIVVQISKKIFDANFYEFKSVCSPFAPIRVTSLSVSIRVHPWLKDQFWDHGPDTILTQKTGGFRCELPAKA